MRKAIIAVCILLAIIGAGTATAQVDCTTSPCVFLPGVQKPRIPTASPTPSNKVVVVSSNAFVPYEGARSLYIVGEVRNETKSIAQLVKITAYLRDSSGQLVRGASAYSYISTLSPDMVSPFLITFSTPPAWSTYELIVTWDTTDRAPKALEIYNTESYFDSSDAFHVRGFVRNQYSELRMLVRIYLTMYDENDQVIGVDSVYTSPTFLKPGQEVLFDIDARYWKYKPDRDKVARYSVQAY